MIKLTVLFQLPEVEVKDHLDDIRSFELHNPAVPNYPITLVAHKDPVKGYWLKEIREYASDLVALAEHAADDLQVTEVPETKEEPKSDEKPVPVKVEPPSQANPESPKTQGNPLKQEVDPLKAPKATGNPKLPEETKANPAGPPKDSAKVVEKRKDSVGDTSEAKKTKVEEADMSRRYSASRYSASSKVVEGKSSITRLIKSVEPFRYNLMSLLATR